MAPNLDSFGRDRALYQEHVKRRTAEREARRYNKLKFPVFVLEQCLILPLGDCLCSVNCRGKACTYSQLKTYLD